MPELRISDVPAGHGAGRRVELTWQDGPSRRVAVADLADQGSQDNDAELIRWYLEEYAEYPADPAPARAIAAEEKLLNAGARLYRQVLGCNADAARIAERARDKLANVRVEVDTDPGEGAGIAWELLRDPDTGTPVALGAAEFVRTHLRAAGHPAPPEPSGDRLRGAAGDRPSWRIGRRAVPLGGQPADPRRRRADGEPGPGRAAPSHVRPAVRSPARRP